jgi:5-(carboxyamino)imidazole ribonucleotide synthase
VTNSGYDEKRVVEPGGLPAGSLLAILGGGQLGRMTAMAARTMGYRVRVMDPDAGCPASFVVDEVITGKWDDVEAARRLATGAGAVTLEIEQIGVDALREVALLAPLRPGVEPVRIIQDKILQKEWLAAKEFPVGDFRVARSEEELAEAVEAFGRVFVKTARGGYDGRGQARLGFEHRATREEIAEAWKALGERPAVVEKALELELEISVMAARSPAGEVRSYPAARNHHERQILAWSVLPAEVPAALEEAAQAVARGIVAELGLEGLVCVEMFVTADGDLLVNELAPRPHNSYHQSERACATSQFEQLVRAACNLPLGDTAVLTPTAIVNLLGEVWLEAPNGKPDWTVALKVPGVRLHLYEKKEARVGRKMGHLSATGKTRQEALERALEAKGLLTARSGS